MVTILSLLAVATLAPVDPRLPAYRPSPAEIARNYDRSDSIPRDILSRAFNVRIEANWLDNGRRFWFRSEPARNRSEFLVFDTQSGQTAPAFDHPRLADALTKAGVKSVDAQSLPFRAIQFVAGKIRFVTDNRQFDLDPTTYNLEAVAAPTPPRPRPPIPWRQSTWPPDPDPVPAPDGQAKAFIRDHNVWIADAKGAERALTRSGSDQQYFARVQWSPDSSRLIAFRVTPGARNPVYLLKSSAPGTTKAQLFTRLYDQPGDIIDTFDIVIVNPQTGVERPVETPRVEYGDMPGIRWCKDKRHFTYDAMDRGYGRWRLFEVDSQTGVGRTLIDDDPATFVDSTSQFTFFCNRSDEVIFKSERDGWNHLYITTGDPARPIQITKGDWLVRDVVKVDESGRYIIFGAGGRHPQEDPYNVHYFRVNFDGSGLVELTPEPGNHSIQLAPDSQALVDTWSQINVAPRHAVRRVSDGQRLGDLPACNIEELRKFGYRPPQPFVAKGRDGKTDIYGIVYRPSNWDRRKRYPVVEDIYAGPHDSFVPKSYLSSVYLQGMAELGFIVVKIDGMGTRNRSKAFQDVCYKNLKDAGFPDRILWMKALAKSDPTLDLDRVGIYGTSAGGQSSTGGLLFHPDFYKVGVSSCGCHDNRIDKIWWNEQWMGYPVGPEYAASSNIENAARLKGRLLLMVGELDTNVPPESTYRLLDALQKARKNVDFALITGADHTSGGPFGDRKRKDYFVKYLLGVDPPEWPNG